MVSKAELEAKRELAKSRHRAVGKKISRLKQTNEVKVGGTKYDPRRELKKLERYNARQLDAYVRELNSFMKRETQFVPDSQRRPMKGDQWKQYKELEKQYNNRATSEYSPLADIPLPHTGMTVGERMSMMTPDHPQAGNPSVNNPYKTVQRKPTNVAGAKKLNDLIKDLKKRLDSRFEAKELKRARDEFSQMMAKINMPDMEKAVNSLTPSDFKNLWYLTSFATDISIMYEVSMALISDKDKPWHSDVFDNAVADAMVQIQWAKNLDKQRKPLAPKQGNRRKRGK